MHANNVLRRIVLSQRPPCLTLRLAGRPTLTVTASPAALFSRRYLSTSNGAPSLQSSRIGDKPGVEGLHQRMHRPCAAIVYLLQPDPPHLDDSKALTIPDPSKQTHELLPASSVLRGDWVLFHPVYTPEELKAVEVGGALPSIFSPDS